MEGIETKIKHMVVLHLNKEMWLTEEVEDKDLTFEINKIFMLPPKLQDDVATFSSFIFVPSISKMYNGADRPFVMHHYFPKDGRNLSEELNEVINSIKD